MRDFFGWSLNLGRWSGVQVRLHVLFLLLLVVALFAGVRGDRQDVTVLGVFVGLLLAGVAIHEAGHCLAARLLSGDCPTVVLWPLGGLVPATVPPPLWRQSVVAMAGPAASLLVAASSAAVLLAQRDDVAGLLHPLEPPYALAGLTWVFVLRMALWINLWLLFAFNLLPASPLDGGRLVGMVLDRWLGETRGRRAADRITQATGVGLCLLAWWVPELYRPFSAWLPLVLLGLFLVFHTWRSPAGANRDDWPHGYDLSQGAPKPSSSRGLHSDEELQETTESTVEQDFAAPASLRPDNPQTILTEEEEDRRMDEILARLHESGMQGLSPDDRALLHRVSARYRNRARR